jgi:hypothetical protein
MADLQRYRINTPQVAFEVFEDEVVMVNFDNGAYYSINGTGSQLLDLLCRGADEEGLIRHIESRYACDRKTVERDVRAFLASLREERLVSAAGSDEASSGNPVPVSVQASAAEAAYKAPAVSKYSDMEDLIMLDPIHEVDESGWPNPKPDTGSQ